MHRIYGHEWIETEHDWICLQVIYISKDCYYVPYEEALQWCGDPPGETVRRPCVERVPIEHTPVDEPWSSLFKIRVFHRRRIISPSRIQAPGSFQMEGVTYQHYSRAPDDPDYKDPAREYPG